MKLLVLSNKNKTALDKIQKQASKHGSVLGKHMMIS